MKLADLIAFAVKFKAAEVRLVVGMPPQLSVGGELHRVNVPLLTVEAIEALLSPVAGPGFGADLSTGREREIQFDIRGIGTIKGRIAAGSIILELPDPASVKDLPRSDQVAGYQISMLLFAIALLGVGTAKFVFGTDLIPEPWRFDGYELMCLFAGTFLIMAGLVLRNHPFG